MTTAVAAVDLGATSGRVFVGRFVGVRLAVEPVARFPNTPVQMMDGLHWNITGLWGDVLAGLTSAVRVGDGIASVAVDSWGADYALLRKGRLLGVPFSYRNPRGTEGQRRVNELVGASALYARNGLQSLPFNSLYQLLDDERAGALSAADSLLFVPDLIGCWLTGEAASEPTIASTSGLLGAVSRSWDLDLASRCGLPADLLPRLIQPGEALGPVAKDLAAAVTALRGMMTVKVASHDTASAVVATPFEQPGSAYLSCGTWALIGMEVPTPVLSEAARLRQFTNEAGAGGQILLQKNLMGLGLLNDLVDEVAGRDLGQLLAAAAEVSLPPDQLIDPADPVFLQPRRTSQLIRAWFEQREAPSPPTLPALVRCVVESLAAAFATALRELEDLTGTNIPVLHVVGGGSQNALLCQRTADRTGKAVVAGPVEASVLGNILLQGRSLGLAPSSASGLREIVRASSSLRRFDPR